MAVAVAMINVAIFAMPVAIALGWWLWIRRGREFPRWGSWPVLAALLAVSANALLYYGWFAYATLARTGDAAGRMHSTLSNYVAPPLVLVAMFGAISGQGSARPFVALAAVLGLLVWLTPGFL